MSDYDNAILWLSTEREPMIDTNKTSQTATLPAKLDIVKRIGNTTFDIHVHFSNPVRVCQRSRS